MRQFLLVSVFLVTSVCASAQNQLFSVKTSEFSFFSKALMEDIEAKNTKASSIINTANRELVVRIPIAQFQFSNRLMQQHFNENYLESEKFPFASVIVPITLPFTEMLTPINGSFEPWSVTFPPTFV